MLQRGHRIGRLARASGRLGQRLNCGIAHGNIRIAFAEALQFDESDVHGAGSAIVLRFPKHRVVGKQRICGSLLEPTPGLCEMSTAVIVVTQSEGCASTDSRTLFALCELDQTLIGHAHRVLM